jgi:hypothetical protein
MGGGRLTEIGFGLAVWETYQALDMLRGGEDQARDVGLDPLKSSGVKKCLAWRPEADLDVQRRRIRQALKVMALKGFAPIPADDDTVAEVGGCSLWAL